MELYMKKISFLFSSLMGLSLIGTASVSAFSQDKDIGTVNCKIETFRQIPHSQKVEGELHFSAYKDDSNHLVIKKVKGYTRFDRDYDTNIAYFSVEQLRENPNYKPIDYLGATQFKKFSGKGLSGFDNDNPHGELVLEWEQGKRKEFQTHFVFQSGDHIGGTLDMKCKLES